MASSRSTSPRRVQKTCHLCSRTGSHAFRRTLEGLYECTTASACRARQRRRLGSRRDGRGRLARNRGADAAVGPPGIVFVIGPSGDDRDEITATLRELTGLTVVTGDPNRRVLSALSTWNVRLIAIDASCLVGVAFRNELTLRHRQPRMHAAPMVVYGDPLSVETALSVEAGAIAFEPDALPIN